MKIANRIEAWPLDRLRPYERNARTHSPSQITKIAASIAEFGFNAPILVDGDGGIIAGHGRLSAALHLGLPEVPVIVLGHLTDAQRRAYILADNRLAELAGWDEAMLAAELLALQDDGFDIELTGFTDDDLAGLLDDEAAHDDPPGVDEDEVPAEPSVPVTRRGDVWVMGRHRLKCGDSTVMTDVADAVGGAQIECMWTDPPYNVAYEGRAGRIQNDDLDDGAFRQFLLDAFTTAKTFMLPGGAAYIAHADGQPGEAFRWAFREAGFKLSGCVIWRKNAMTLSRSDYQWQHEPILYGWKQGAAHRWYGERNKTTIIDFEGGAFQQIGEREWQISIGEQTLIVEGDGVTVRDARPSVVTEEKPKRNDAHPTMKPVALIERFLLNSTKPGDVVLDVFGGSGSTLIACEKLGRSSRLVEIDEKFADVILRRWQDYTGKAAALEATGETFDQLQERRAIPARKAANDDHFVLRKKA